MKSLSIVLFLLAACDLAWAKEVPLPRAKPVSAAHPPPQRAAPEVLPLHDAEAWPSDCVLRLAEIARFTHQPSVNGPGQCGAGAVANPFVTILGHMTGRQLLRRVGYEVDVGKVLKACADHGIAVEINANPWRLDLDWRWHQRGLELGCIFSINPDAHSIAELDLMRWGLAMARKGGLSADRVLNARKLRDFSDWLEDHRRRIAPARAGWRGTGHSVGRGRLSSAHPRKISASQPAHAKRGRYRIRSA
jgi:hypothetical protein